MDDQVKLLIEKEVVVETINTLFIATDERDWARVRECFASEVLFDVSSMTGDEPARLDSEDIVGAWETGLRPLQAMHHQAGNYRVRIKGSEADVRCYGIAYHYLPNPSGDNTRVFVGSCDFT